MGSRAERSLDLERLRDLINTEVKNLRQRKQLGKLSIAVRPNWDQPAAWAWVPSLISCKKFLLYGVDTAFNTDKLDTLLFHSSLFVFWSWVFYDQMDRGFCFYLRRLLYSRIGISDVFQICQYMVVTLTHSFLRFQWNWSNSSSTGIYWLSTGHIKCAIYRES